MATKEELQTQANAEIEAKMTANGGDGCFISINSVRREYNDAEYARAKIDLGNTKWNRQQFDYITDRQQAYGSIGDQLDLLYHDMTADKGDKTGEWYKAVKKVKDDNPKPS